MIRYLVLSNRSYRRFDQSEEIDEGTLRELIDLARCTPSAGNLQPLKYVLSWEASQNERVFSTLSWAGYLSDWNGPSDGEKPSAYVVVLIDTQIAKATSCDSGIAAQTILLGAVEKGLGGCIFGSVDRSALRESLRIPERFEILLVIALGRPVEEVVLENVKTDGSIKYYRDDRGIHHVPKRSLDDIVLDFQGRQAIVD